VREIKNFKNLKMARRQINWKMAGGAKQFGLKIV
jgi:hypothetical protein